MLKKEHNPFVPIIWALIIFIVLANAVSAQPVSSVREPVPMFNSTAGYVGIVDNVGNSIHFGAEYRFAELRKWGLIPTLGLSFAEDGAYFAYSEIRRDFWLNNKWLLIPSFGVGVFNASEEFQLGSRLQFRSGIEIAFRFHEQYRLGLAFFHISNGGFYDRNPGTEILVLGFSVPITPRASK